MADIRKRSGSKGITYQVRYPSKASKSGYAFKTFSTLKEAREFRETNKKRMELGFEFLKAAKKGNARRLSDLLQQGAPVNFFDPVDHAGLFITSPRTLQDPLSEL